MNKREFDHVSLVRRLLQQVRRPAVAVLTSNICEFAFYGYARRERRPLVPEKRLRTGPAYRVLC